MRLLRKAHAWLIAANLAACVTAPVVVPRAPTPVRVRETPPEAPRAAGLDVVVGLAARGVFHDNFARGTLYTWTTAAQVLALRERPRLLVAEASAGTGQSPYLRALAAIVAARGPGHALAATLLEHPALRRRRYAWTSPFATTMGLGPVRYGDALVRVELDPRALLLRFCPGDAEPFAVVDMRGQAVPLAELSADPQRLGAVYHVRDGARDEVPFREYVLCNEAMIAAWSVATLGDPRAGGRGHRDADRAGRRPAGGAAGCGAAFVADADVGPRARRGDADRHWHASLAFANARYQPSAAYLAEIVAALRGYDGTGAPLIWRPAHTAQSAQTSR
jgi:hypothetical protein